MRKLIYFACTALFLSSCTIMPEGSIEALRTQINALRDENMVLYNENKILLEYNRLAKQTIWELDSIYNLADTYFENPSTDEYLEIEQKVDSLLGN